MKRKIFISIVFLAVIYVIGLFTGILPITINTSNYSGVDIALDSGEYFNPLGHIELSKNNTIAYIVYSKDDMYSGRNLLPGKVLYSNDYNLILELKEKSLFQYTGSDMATVDSYFYLFVEGELKFQSGIVLEKESMGFQNSDFGWVENSETLDVFRKFKRTYLPVIFL